MMRDRRIELEMKPTRGHRSHGSFVHPGSLERLRIRGSGLGRREWRGGQLSRALLPFHGSVHNGFLL